MAGKLPGGETVEFMEQTADEDEATVLLYVKAGANGLTYGACPFCQSAVMMLLAKVGTRVVESHLAMNTTTFKSVIS